jgi:hypothetical protein
LARGSRGEQGEGEAAMSKQKPELVEGSGWRVSDARVVAPLHNQICAVIGRGDIPEAVILRRLRMLSAMLSSMANAAFCADPEAEGEAIADDFWARRASGERGEADDA